MDDFLITVKDIRYGIGKGCMCVSGAKLFCDKNGISWEKLVKEGIYCSVFEKFDDEMVRTFLRVCKEKRYGRE